MDFTRLYGKGFASALFFFRGEDFGEDDEGNGTVLVSGPLTDEQLKAAQLAEANCPESAVILEAGQ